MRRVCGGTDCGAEVTQPSEKTLAFALRAVFGGEARCRGPYDVRFTGMTNPCWSAGHRRIEIGRATSPSVSASLDTRRGSICHRDDDQPACFAQVRCHHFDTQSVSVAPTSFLSGAAASIDEHGCRGA